MLARSRARSTDSLAALAAAAAAAASSAASPASLGRANNIAARQFIVYESTASHAARPREQSHLLGTPATLRLLLSSILPFSFHSAVWTDGSLDQGMVMGRAGAALGVDALSWNGLGFLALSLPSFVVLLPTTNLPSYYDKDFPSQEFTLFPP